MLPNYGPNIKKLRNTINNRRRHEENKFKAEKIGDSLSSASDTWRVAKTFMDWTASSGPPNQLEVAGKLITKALDIASHMNSFFIEKVRKLRNSIERAPVDFDHCRNIMEVKDVS